MKSNIDMRGRIARAITGAMTLGAGVACWFFEWPASPGWRWTIVALLVFGGLFQFYEAKKAWCVTRACGIKTPM
jgi:hypothetical protein